MGTSVSGVHHRVRLPLRLQPVAPGGPRHRRLPGGPAAVPTAVAALGVTALTGRHRRCGQAGGRVADPGRRLRRAAPAHLRQLRVGAGSAGRGIRAPARAERPGQPERLVRAGRAGPDGRVGRAAAHVHVPGCAPLLRRDPIVFEVGATTAGLHDLAWLMTGVAVLFPLLSLTGRSPARIGRGSRSTRVPAIHPEGVDKVRMGQKALRSVACRVPMPPCCRDSAAP